jgi:hypothetical protein
VPSHSTPRASKAPTSFTPAASLAALGARLRSLDLFDAIRQHVHIPQKTVVDAPADKLFDAFVALLSGAHGLCEVNTRLRPDSVLQRAFGRDRCAEQSVVQDTLDATTDDSVRQMHFAADVIFARHSAAMRHAFARELLVLDIDLTGKLCGPRAEGASRGYFANVPKGKSVVGRQLGRVTAAPYNEIVADRLFPGNVVLESVLTELVIAAERALVLSPERRARTLIRMDAGGGGVPEIDWLLERGYQLMVKAMMPVRAADFAATVEVWHTDPRHEGREVGWVGVEEPQYARPVRLLALRSRDARGQWAYGIVVTTIEAAEARRIAGALPNGLSAARREALSYARAYDKRAGAIEIENKQDKMGLGIVKRQKRKLAAARMVTALDALAHNVLVWARRWLSATATELGKLGLLRWIRDVLHISGEVELYKNGEVRRVRLNGRAPKARLLAEAFNAVYKRVGLQVRVSAE